MKKLILLALVAIFFIQCTPSVQDSTTESPPQSDGVFPYPIHQKLLDNGLNVVTVEYPSPGLAAFYIVVEVGSREEVEKGKSGFAHFFEHMMFRGTEKYSKEAYGEVMKTIGAAANANTWLDRTVYHMTGNAEMLDKMFELEADRFMNLKYSVHDFKTEAGAVKGEYTKNFASPYQQLNEKTASVAFDNHTYQHTTIGFWEDVVDMPNQYEYSLEFFDRFYRPEYTTILVVGDVKMDNVNQLAQEYFGKWERGDYNADIPVEPAQQKTRHAHIKNENFPPYLGLNFKSPAFNDSTIDNAALDVISTLLFSERSDLYKKLVIEEQKLRSLSGGFFYTKDPYLYTISASFVDAKDMQYVHDEIMRALEDIKNNPVEEELIQQTKSKIKYSFAMAMDNPTDIASELSYYIWLTGRPESMNNTYEMVEKVTQQDMMDVAKKYFNTKSLTISTISPDEKPGI